ncbi:hypothetical protein ANCDUO_13086 [Ancylostoma duodenale]|uniref:Uncharacterized protein n=1 Tax=Ancylostoma duodenale TaxID=51022 RepID=A0A0C2GI28_9BILA|nr:hypothetical protein ANCDUO_13086 [Ancylostoma duodenale]
MLTATYHYGVLINLCMNPTNDKAAEGKSNRALDQALSVDPEVATFTPAGGTSEHMLVNLSDKHLAIKAVPVKIFKAQWHW